MRTSNQDRGGHLDNRYRYRQDDVPARRPRQAWRHRAAAEGIAQPAGTPAGQCATLPGRHGGLLGAHHIGRQLEALGHNVRLIPAQYVKPFLKGHKNDYRDAEAIAEAVQRPTMHFVRIKHAPLQSPDTLMQLSRSPAQLSTLRRTAGPCMMAQSGRNRSVATTSVLEGKAGVNQAQRLRPILPPNRDPPRAGLNDQIAAVDWSHLHPAWYSSAVRP